LGHKGNHRYLASIELIDAAENSRREEGCNLVLQFSIAARNRLCRQLLHSLSPEENEIRKTQLAIDCATALQSGGDDFGKK
jgi:hypothetical protein